MLFNKDRDVRKCAETVGFNVCTRNYWLDHVGNFKSKAVSISIT